MTRLARLSAMIALALLIAGCMTPSDPRLDDSDVAPLVIGSPTSSP